MTADLPSTIRAAVSLAHADAEFREACGSLSFGISLYIDDGNTQQALDLLEVPGSSALELHAHKSVWQHLTQQHPPVGFHSFTAAIRDSSRMAVTGTPLQVAQALHALERFCEILRGQHQAQPLAIKGIEHIVGRYVNVSAVTGSAIYYEHAGNPDAPPLLMLHTAGADSRQYHHVLADEELQKSWSMFAFDMPGHGRSLPGSEGLWQGYRLTKQQYQATCIAFIREVIRQPAAVMGCSMGAAMTLYLGKMYPSEVAAMIALEAPYRALGRKVAYLSHSQVNQAAHNPSYVRGLMSPFSPLHHRRVAAWIYSQGGFQIYPGDLSFYSEEFDAEVDLAGLDGNNRPVCLLTGAYDYSASPADSQKVCDLIPGARFICMQELGHFPMVEHPEAFLRHARPVLDDVNNWMRQRAQE